MNKRAQSSHDQAVIGMENWQVAYERTESNLSRISVLSHLAAEGELPRNAAGILDLGDDKRVETEREDEAL